MLMIVWLFSVAGCSMLVIWSFHVRMEEKERSRKRNQMYQFVVEVQNHFQYEPDVLYALECALSNVHERVRFYQQFLDAVTQSLPFLEQESGGEEVEDFLEELEWYEKIFLFMCIAVENMEIRREVFLNEMNRLCRRLKEEQIAEQKMHNCMSGTAFVGIVPCLMLPAFRWFSIRNLPELRTMYDGCYGILTLLLIVLSLCVTTAVLELMRRKLWERKEEKEWELNCWESVFLKETYRVDVELILDWLILFSKETKGRLMDIRSAYEQFGCDGFVDEVWLDGNTDWEKQMLYSLQNSDRVGIRDAFYRKEQELESGHMEESQRKEDVLGLAASVAPVISFVPFYVTVGFYLVVPFVTESLKQLSGILASMEQIW